MSGSFCAKLTRRAAFAGAFALAAARAAPAFARSGVGAVRVDATPLRAAAGDPTAAWVEAELPTALAGAFAGRRAPDSGGLTVRIETLTLGPNVPASVHGGSSPDSIGGVALVCGQSFPVRATTKYMVDPIDQTRVEQSNRERVSRLVEALAFWIARGDFF